MSAQLSDLLRTGAIPMREGAESEAFRVVRATFADVEPISPRRRYSRRVVLALALVALVAAALSPPGTAVLGSIRDAVARERVEQSQPRLLKLPSGGRLLVDSDAGPWIVKADGAKRLLGDYGSASWSPHGLFVAATRRSELSAVTPQGVVRWTLPLRAVVRNPRWAPSGYRVAYFAGPDLHVVVGNGTGDEVVARGDPAVAPAWRPGTRHILAFAQADGLIRVLDLDAGTTLLRYPIAQQPIQLGWSADGRRLIVLDRGGIRTFDEDIVVRRGLRNRVAVEFGPAPTGEQIAIVARVPGEDRSELLLFRPSGASRRVFEGAGSFSGVEWSPDGTWLLLAWKSADQWLFIRSAGVPEIRAVSNISRQFAGGPDLSPGFAELRGWCCSALAP
jgi:hypothetical protein